MKMTPAKARTALVLLAPVILLGATFGAPKMKRLDDLRHPLTGVWETLSTMPGKPLGRTEFRRDGTFPEVSYPRVSSHRFKKMRYQGTYRVKPGHSLELNPREIWWGDEPGSPSTFDISNRFVVTANGQQASFFSIGAGRISKFRRVK